LWLTLAKGQQHLGLNISNEQIWEMGSYVTNIPYARVQKIERETHHDVMAHLKAYAAQCPKAAPIIHLGATSAYIVDNADAKIMRDAAMVIIRKAHALVTIMTRLAYKYTNTPVLAYTHFQPAQPTTFGKRICMWLQDLENDLGRFKHETSNIRILGCKGATGTCASFMELFDGDYEKVRQLDEYVSNALGIRSVEISGQTYSRKQDYYLFSVISGMAQTLAKMANDLRLMSGRGEFYEPFGDKQVGSSAMAYKQNPLRCEKVVSLSRLVINNTTAMADTASNQWLERSLDDSAIRRVIIPETFMALDEMLMTMKKVLTGCTVREDVMRDNMRQEIPKMVSEGVLMLAVRRGGNRQELHEVIRQYATRSPHDFLVSVLNDGRFDVSGDEMEELANPDKLVGAAPMQVEEYLEGRKSNEKD
jgi:adenylosuccinate lyase